jgi:aminoglycoside phosphotransferase (APT) family kinase protein
MTYRKERVDIMETSTKNWLTNEQITAVVQKHFKDEKITNIQRYKEGTLNTVYLIEGTDSLSDGVILKTAPATDTDMPNIEKGGLYTEIYVYHLLQGVDIPVPEMYAYDFSRKDIPCDYLFLERVKGKSWSKHLFDFKLIRKSNPGLMNQLGKINAVLHGVEGDWFGYIKDNGCHRYDLWSDAFTAMVHDLFEEAKQRGYSLPYTEIRETVNSSFGSCHSYCS